MPGGELDRLKVNDFKTYEWWIIQGARNDVLFTYYSGTLIWTWCRFEKSDEDLHVKLNAALHPRC